MTPDAGGVAAEALEALIDGLTIQDHTGGDSADLLRELAAAVEWLTIQDHTGGDAVWALVAAKELAGYCATLVAVLAASVARAAASAPRSGLVLDGARVTTQRTVSRRKVRHTRLLEALDVLADTADHRIDPATGDDIGRAAARLRLRDRTMSPSWRWAEIERLGLTPGDYCAESVGEAVTVTLADGAKVTARAAQP